MLTVYKQMRLVTQVNFLLYMLQRPAAGQRDLAGDLALA